MLHYAKKTQGLHEEFNLNFQLLCHVIIVSLHTCTCSNQHNLQNGYTTAD